MDNQKRAERRQQLADAVADRYAKRKAARDAELTKVNTVGVFKAAGMDAALRRVAHMTINEGRAIGATRNFEAIVGADDSDPVNFLGRGTRSARAVCRLTVGGAPVGTGFLVAPGVILTNNHVIGSEAEAGSFMAEFDFELDEEDRPRSPVIRFGLEPSRMFVTSDSTTGLDFTFVAVAGRSLDGKVALSRFGWIPLDPRIDKILIGEPAVIVQHPRGELKRVAVFAAELADKLDDYLHYTSDTDPGSSGSTVQNRSWQLVALHHASVATGEQRRGHPVIVNEGVRVSSILKALREKPEHVTGDAEETYAAISKSTVVMNGRPQPGIDEAAPERIAAVETAEVGRGVTVLESTAIRTRPKGHFAGRDGPHFGYQPGFLGTAVGLPKLPQFLEEDAAPVDGGGIELRYTHYSSVLSVSRRIPIFTAVNIDGKLSRKLARTDRKFEAADVWCYDPRVSKEHQLGPAIYDRTDFDFGHLVRREDPVWGDVNTSRMANDDTFYMTNAAPQHHELNTKTWLALENAILSAARGGAAKVTVFTGPVLSVQDPEVLGVQVPTAFWKVVAYVEKGKLRSHGFVQWQTKLVADMKVRPEALSGLEAAAAYAVPIREIARMTSLDFGALIGADVMPAGRGTRRRIRESTVGGLFEIPTVERDPVEELPEEDRAAAPRLTGEEIEVKMEIEIRDLREEIAELRTQVRALLGRG